MNRLGRVLADMSPRTILAIGWLGLFVYAYPGYMSYDSVQQLLQARSGAMLDNHPPAMAALWHGLDALVSGPVGMLILQTACFQAGVYLLLRTRMNDRKAAVIAGLMLWFPPIANTMGVIWKDSQMAAYLVLGAALLLSPRLRNRLFGLGLISLATAMRYNALAMTFPLVVLLFYWSANQRWWKRYPIALAAWVVVTMTAQTANRVLASKHVFMWHQSLALLDIVGTLRYADDIPDAELGRDLAGTPLAVADHFQANARRKLVADANPADDLWNATYAFFKRPPDPDPEMRANISRAWKAIVLAHPAAYMHYRGVLFAQLVQLDDTPLGSPVYYWFTDVQEPYRTGASIGHFAAPSRFQTIAHDVMDALGETWIFHVGLYAIVSVLLLPLCWGDRQSLAVIGSGLTGELGLLVVSPTVDTRYSFWLMVAAILGAIMIAARRIRSRGSS